MIGDHFFMKTNNNQQSAYKIQNIEHSFTGTQLTNYAGVSPIMKYLNRLKLGEKLNDFFPTLMYNASKFSTVQIMLAVVLASFAGIKRLQRIAYFSRDVLVMALLNLKTGLNKDVISTRLKQLGQAGAFKLQEMLFPLATKWLSKSQLQSISLDADSTVKTVYGHQQGAEKGYNPHKPGAKSYHPLLAFVSELKLVVNSWFRTGSAYTANGICEFIKQIKAILPPTISHVFFRGDSGFFNGELFDLLETYQWTYLVKVKLKNLKQLLNGQQWIILDSNPELAYCEFSYQGANWKKKRTLKALRLVTEWVEAEFMGQKQQVPKYEYICYCSNLAGDVLSWHKRYCQRATSENWVEQVKNQLPAGATTTDNFFANDILWQLSVLAYNLSVMMRYRVKKLWRQEHATFRDWFINIPAKLLHAGRQFKLKIYEHYYDKEKWLKFDQELSLAY